MVQNAAPQSVQPSQEPARHTATPWTVRQFDHSVVLQGPGKIQVMSTSWHSSIRSSYPLKAESLANAAFVLEAVNFHASLKARVEELEAALREVLESDGLSAMEGCDCETCAPIARAKGILDVARGP